MCEKGFFGDNCGLDSTGNNVCHAPTPAPTNNNNNNNDDTSTTVVDRPKITQKPQEWNSGWGFAWKHTYSAEVGETLQTQIQYRVAGKTKWTTFSADYAKTFLVSKKPLAQSIELRIRTLVVEDGRTSAWRLAQYIV